MKREAAFLSDVHGNLPALEAVLADLSRRGVTEIYFLGDVLGKGPAVGEVISLLRARCTGAVYGNWDKLVLHGKDVERFGASYYRERLSAEDRAYLLSLPESLEIDFCGRSVLMYHGRFSISCVVTPMFNNSRDNVEKALYRFGPHDITLMGDAHHPFMLTHQGRFLMNTGAVGNPCDRMPLASYLILRDENGVFSSEHVRVPYDLNRAVSIALHTPQLPMLETYINETVTAVYSRSYKPNTSTPQTNPWEELPLSVYQLQTGVLGLREPLDKLLHNQLRDHPAKSYLLFGITDGSGLENAPLAHDTRIIGVDINEDYLRACEDFAAAAGESGKLCVLRLWNSGGFETLNPRMRVELARRFPQPWEKFRRSLRLAPRVFLEPGDMFDWPDMSAEELGENCFCYGLRDQVGVLCDGTVVPCCLDHDGDIPLGNLFERELDEILASPRAVAIREGFSRRRAVEELCRRCGYARRF